MGRVHDDKDLPDLTERRLMDFAPADAGWVSDLAVLPDEMAADIGELLKRRLTASQADRVLLDLKRIFGTAVEMAKAECALREAASHGDAGSKKKSAKLGVQLRTKLGNLRAEFENDALPDCDDICARILEDPVLARLITLLIEERTSLKVTDPLRNSTSLAIGHLPQVLDLLFYAVDRGVVTGRAEPALNFLAECVVRAVTRAAGWTPGRTWDDYAAEETGIGAKTCRILAQALNNAVPADCRKSQPADMTKPFRNAIRIVREAG